MDFLPEETDEILNIFREEAGREKSFFAETSAAKEKR